MRSLSDLASAAGRALAVTAVAAAGALSVGPGGSAAASAASPAVSLVSHGGEHVRLAGQDRYATAAEVSRRTFPGGAVPVVHVVTGAGFADALAGGPAAAVLGGPVLPVAADGVPAVIAQELTRLEPQRIVVLGGTAAVSSAVEQALRAYTDGPVDRVAGRDRYETAAAVALAAFDGPVPQAIVATGEGFADALAGGAVGASTRSPVLLVRSDGVPAATAAALRELRPADIAVLGGTAAVADPVLDALRPYTGGGVNRLAGADRAGTAARLAEVFWPRPAQTVYLATGQQYPDALAAVPAAGADRAPLLLARQDCLPDTTLSQLDRLSPQTVVVVGGQAAVAEAALTTPCAPAPPAPACGTAAAAAYDSSARCLYAAFVAGDRQAAAQYATTAVLDRLFQSRQYPGYDDWQYQGCGPPRETRPSSGVACHYVVPSAGHVHGTDVELAMRVDFVAEDIAYIG